PDRSLDLRASVAAPTDGDDYIEGNGGNDTIFGDLGQDDIIGDNSNLFSLDNLDRRRPVGADLIFGGTGTDIDRKYEVAEKSDLAIAVRDQHGRDADMIVGDNGNVFRVVGTKGLPTGA